jgi:hypothetical protein
MAALETAKCAVLCPIRVESGLSFNPLKTSVQGHLVPCIIVSMFDTIIAAMEAHHVRPEFLLDRASLKIH